VSRCRDLATNESLAGTAPQAKAWLAIEDPGPWGPQVSAGVDLPEGVRTLLIRRSRTRQEPRSVFLAVPQTQLLAQWQCHDLAELNTIDFAGIIQGRVSPPLCDRRLTLVCTNGKRDQCCAVDGRALIDQLADLPDVWECSHIGGHRFAPVVLHLPDGHVYGRVSAAEGRQIATDQVPAAALRGPSHYPSRFQAGAVALRQAVSGLNPHDAIDFAEDSDGAIRAVTQGGTWHIRVREIELERVESCGKDPVSGTGWQVEAVTRVQ
jgi:hypothetical protein